MALYPCVPALVGTDRRPEVRIGHVKLGWQTDQAQQLRQEGEDGLRQGGCGSELHQCIPLMPGDTKVQLDHSARFAGSVSRRGDPVRREIEEALCEVAR